MVSLEGEQKVVTGRVSGWAQGDCLEAEELNIKDSFPRAPLRKHSRWWGVGKLPFKKNMGEQ